MISKINSARFAAITPRSSVARGFAQGERSSPAVSSPAFKVSISGKSRGLFAAAQQSAVFAKNTGGISAEQVGVPQDSMPSDAGSAVRILDAALDKVNGLRGYLGALQADTLEPAERS